MADRTLGKIDRVLTLVLRRHATVPERDVAAVRAGVVADVEVLARLPTGQIQLAAGPVIVSDGRQEQQREPGCEAAQRSGRACRPPPALYDAPHSDDRDECERVLAREAQAAERESQREPRTPPRWMIDQAAQNPERQAHEEHVQHGLLEQAVEKDRRRVNRQAEAGDQADARTEQTPPRQGEEHTGGRADDGLADANGQEAATGRAVDRTEEIGIQRRLEERLL